MCHCSYVIFQIAADLKIFEENSFVMVQFLMCTFHLIIIQDEAEGLHTYNLRMFGTQKMHCMAWIASGSVVDTLKFSLPLEIEKRLVK